MTAEAGKIDRAALVRRAFLELVAERGFRGTSMAGVADKAGVAAGTIYVHFGSKDDLILATYLQIKRDLSAAGLVAIDPDDPPAARFERLWHAIYRHLAADPVRARFLIQVESSPYAATALAAALKDPDEDLTRLAYTADMADLLAELPIELLFDLGIGPAVRLAAAEGPTGSDPAIDDALLDRVATACWRAITVS